MPRVKLLLGFTMVTLILYITESHFSESRRVSLRSGLLTDILRFPEGTVYTLQAEIVNGTMLGFLTVASMVMMLSQNFEFCPKSVSLYCPDAVIFLPDGQV